MITIKVNQKSMTESDVIREYVVQSICDSFLCNNIYHTFCPKIHTWQPRTDLVCLNGRGFISKEQNHCNVECVEFSRAEMKLAFKLLQDSGYYMIEYRFDNGAIGYCCEKEKNPKYSNGRRVTQFTYWD